MLGLSLFGLALAHFPPCAECYESHCWDLCTAILCITHPPTGWCYIGSYTPQVCAVASEQYWKSHSKENIQATFVMEKGATGLALGACLMWPCLVPSVFWSIRTITEKNSRPCNNDAMKVQTPKSRRWSLTLGGTKHQSGESCSREEGQNKKQVCVLIK
jgi:hypothetical protein